jgi:hypothetical protein
MPGVTRYPDTNVGFPEISIEQLRVRAFAVLGNLTKDERLAPFAVGAGAVATMLQHHDRKNAPELEGVVKVRASDCLCLLVCRRDVVCCMHMSRR